MIFGAKEEIIPTYYDDDKPKSVQKIAFGLVRIILLWLRVYKSFDIYVHISLYHTNNNKNYTKNKKIIKSYRKIFL